MLARIEIPFPVFLPNPGLMSAKQINNSTSVGNAEKRVKNNLNKKIMKMNYKTVFFPKKSTTNHLLPLNNLVKKQFSWIYVSLPFVLCDRCAWIPEKQFPTASLGIPNTCRKIPAFENNIVGCLKQWFESIVELIYALLHWILQTIIGHCPLKKINPKHFKNHSRTHCLRYNSFSQMSDVIENREAQNKL